ncbi:hypothetical protein KBA27_04300 [bacterium]|nr:hypothetical protein [bacterium]
MQMKEVVAEKSLSVKDLWEDQHPLIHTWFLLSSVSICFISAVFLMTP